MRVWFWMALYMMSLSLSAKGQEFRVGASAEVELFPKLEGELEIEGRRIFNPETYHSQIIQGELNYSLTNSWSAGIMYNHAFVIRHSENEEGAEGDENSDRNKFAVDLVFQSKRFENDLSLTNRFRYQVATSDDSKPKQYIRNKITLDYRITKKMNPYIALEPYFNLRKNQINIVRLYLGNEMPVFGTTVEIYYIAEVHLEAENFFIQYVIGTTFELDFKK